MKIKLLFAFLLVSFFAVAQPTNYQNIAARYRWMAGYFIDGFHVPGYSTVPNLRTGVWPGAGNIGLDTVAHKFYFYSGGTWREVAPAIDSLIWSTRAWRQKGDDSLAALINLKLNISDTANIRARLAAGANITLTGTYPNITIAAAGGSGGTPGGNSRNIQFNMDGVFDGNDSLKWAAAKLSVVGSFDATGSLYLPNSTSSLGSIYKNNFRWLHNSGGGGNIYLGFDSGNDSTDAENNIAIGFDALNDNNGKFNIAIGYTAANNLKSGASLFDGDENIAIGHESMKGATGGRYSIALGIGGLQSLQDGSTSNIAIGKSVLQSLTQGIGNTYVGSALHLNDGDYNTVLGANATIGGTTYDNNTIIGANSMQNLTTGSNNLSAGINSGGANTTGEKNTYLGPYAAYNVNGSNNIFLGNWAGALVGNTSNRLIIQSQESGNATIVGDLFNRRIGINAAENATINSTLEVNGTLLVTGNSKFSGLNTGIPSGAKRILMATDGTIYAADTINGGSGSGITLGTSPFGLTKTNDSTYKVDTSQAATIALVQKKIDSLAALVSTNTQAVFGAGSGAAGDTAAFSTSAIYGSYFWDGTDTLVVTKSCVTLQGTSANIDYDIFFNDSLNVTAGASTILSSINITSTTTAYCTDEGFITTKIPPGNWVWVKTSTLTTKPTYFSLSLIGYKKRVI